MSASDDPHAMSLDEQLVAYLDGELDADAAKRLDARLAKDAELHRKLIQHQRAWALLDELPRTNVDEQFTRTTVEMVAVSAANEVEQAWRRTPLRTWISWLVGGTVTAAAALAGYALVASIVAAPNRQLVEDLRVIEHLDEYRAVEEIEFLRALEREGLFVAEGLDDP